MTQADEDAKIQAAADLAAEKAAKKQREKDEEAEAGKGGGGLSSMLDMGLVLIVLAFVDALFGSHLMEMGLGLMKSFMPGFTGGKAVEEATDPNNTKYKDNPVLKLQHILKVPESGNITDPETVKAVQARLKEIGAYHGEVTGKIDQQTYDAVKSFRDLLGADAAKYGLDDKVMADLQAIVAAGNAPAGPERGAAPQGTGTPTPPQHPDALGQGSASLSGSTVPVTPDEERFRGEIKALTDGVLALRHPSSVKDRIAAARFPQLVADTKDLDLTARSPDGKPTADQIKALQFVLKDVGGYQLDATGAPTQETVNAMKRMIAEQPDMAGMLGISSRVIADVEAHYPELASAQAPGAAPIAPGADPENKLPEIMRRLRADAAEFTTVIMGYVNPVSPAEAAPGIVTGGENGNPNGPVITGNAKTSDGPAQQH